MNTYKIYLINMNDRHKDRVEFVDAKSASDALCIVKHNECCVFDTDGCRVLRVGNIEAVK